MRNKMVITEQFWGLLGLNKIAPIVLLLVPSYQDFYVSHPKPLVNEKGLIRANFDLSPFLLSIFFSILKGF